MTSELFDFGVLRRWANLEDLSESIEAGSIISSAVETTVSEQIELLRNIIIEPARYAVSDLALDSDVSKFFERVLSAQSIGSERAVELADNSECLGEMLAISDGYQDCAFAIGAAQTGLVNAASDASIAEGEDEDIDSLKPTLERLANLFRVRLEEATRVTAELARRTSDIAIFVEDAQPVVFVYSIVLERQRQVTSALMLSNPSPLLAAELKQISESTAKVLELERELIESNKKTRAKVRRIKREHQERLDRLNPLKILEGLTQAIGDGLSDLGDGLSVLGEGLGDLGRGINIAWNDARREIWIGLTNVFREFTVGICRLQHGSPDKDKDGDGDGKNKDFYKCMDDGWQASVTFNGDGEVTDVMVNPPGIPIPISIGLITDADREAQKRRIEERSEAVRQFNDAVRSHFQPGPDINLDHAFFGEIGSSPESFFKPFGAATYPLLERDESDTEPFIDKSGKEWPSKRAFKAALTEIHIGRIDSALTALNDDMITNEYIQLGAFWFASMAAYETAVGMVKDISSATAKGAMTLFAVTKDIASGNDVSLRLLVNISGIPLVDTFEAWITLQTWSTDAASAQASQIATKRFLREQKKLLEDNLKDLRGS